MARSINIQLGKKVKEFRKKRNLTQEQLAEFAKTSYKYIQRIEGKSPPDLRLSTIERIAKALHVTMAKLLDT